MQTQSLSKHYGDFAALDRCNLHVARGEVFGLLGPNGSGKTTLLRLLMGYLCPTDGVATIAGFDCWHQSVAVHREVSYLPAEAKLFREMRGRQVLRFFADLRTPGTYERSLAVVERLDLDLTRKVSQYSTGMRQKLAIAATLATETPLLILDEPTANLDPTARSEVLQLVREAQTAGRTVIFSSHVMSEVEQTCDRVVLLRRGRLVHEQPMHTLRRQHRIYARLAGNLTAAPSAIAHEVRIIKQGQGEVLLETAGELSPLLGWLATLKMDEVRIEPVGLQPIYDRYLTDESSGVGNLTEVNSTTVMLKPTHKPAVSNTDHSQRGER